MIWFGFQVAQLTDRIGQLQRSGRLGENLAVIKQLEQQRADVFKAALTSAQQQSDYDDALSSCSNVSYYTLIAAHLHSLMLPVPASQYNFELLVKKFLLNIRIRMLLKAPFIVRL